MIRSLICLILVLGQVGCRWNPNAVLGGEEHEDHHHNGGNSTLPVQGATPHYCQHLYLAKMDEQAEGTCALPAPIDPLIEKIETTGTSQSKLLITFNAIKDEEFPKILKLVFKGGLVVTPDSNTFKTLTCRNVTPVDDIPKTRIFECTIKKDQSYPTYILHSMELSNEKCGGKVVYETKYSDLDCSSQSYDKWSNYTVWIDKLRVPDL